MELSRQECGSGLPFPSLEDHTLSELSTMILLSWVVLHGMAHSFNELDNAVINLVSFLWLWFPFYMPPMDEDKRLVEASWWEGFLMGRLPDGKVLDLVGKVILSKYLMQFSTDGWGVLMEVIWPPSKRLMPESETPGHSQGSLAQRTVWT